MPQSDNHEDHRVAQNALDIAITTMRRFLPCQRKTDKPRSQCIFAAMDSQGVQCGDIDPSALCLPCRAIWLAESSSVILHCIEASEVEAVRCAAEEDEQPAEARPETMHCPDCTTGPGSQIRAVDRGRGLECVRCGWPKGAPDTSEETP